MGDIGAETDRPSAHLLSTGQLRGEGRRVQKTQKGRSAVGRTSLLHRVAVGRARYSPTTLSAISWSCFLPEATASNASLAF